MDHIIATSDSWDIKPFKEMKTIPFETEYSQEEFNKIIQGLIPEQMEDKWFIYYEQPSLFFYRSWTGEPIYKLNFTEVNNKAKVTEAFVSNNVADEDTIYYNIQLVDFLIANLLLGQHKPFPILADTKQPIPGVYQHHISGTGYQEKVIRCNKPWWKFW